MHDGARAPNHLEGQTSPYLLQHLYNPVDWYPWCETALQKAKSEDKPIFVSIGYAACHWCHVMERESFEKREIAEVLNRHFVSIKVDREERPDIDEIYMNAVQLLTGAGGWPLNAFLTPDLQPFAAGTYFPPTTQHGRMGFLELLQRIREAWDGRRDDVERSAAELTDHLRHLARGGLGGDEGAAVGRAEHGRAVADLTGRFESRWGGFGGAPKFPPDGALGLLLREHERSGESVPLQMVEQTLAGMACGGIYDHVGGGFARYSVDAMWLVPHFEKMLYNQALLVPAYVDAFKLTGKALYRRVVEETLDFVRRELTDEAGGFHSSLDADSEGVEGRFYVWSPAEVRAELGDDAGQRFCEVYGITDDGNFEGRSIPNLLHGSLEDQASARGLTEAELVRQLAAPRAALLEARQRRVRPATDDKVLTSWNGLMISAFARAFQTLRRPQDLRAARAAAEFVASRMLEGQRLRVSYRAGQAQLNGYLDDYAFFARGLVDLYEACFERRYLALAERLTRTLIDRFADAESGGFYFVSDDHERLLTRTYSLHDGALPSGAGVAVELLLRLALHLDRPAWRETAHRALQAHRPAVARAPSAFGSLLAAADLARGPVIEVAIIGSPDAAATRELLAVIHADYRPRLALAVGRAEDEDAPALLAGKTQLDGRATAYVCRDYACRTPVTDPQALRLRLEEATRPE